MSSAMRVSPLTIAFVGWGAINSRVAELLIERSANVQFVAVATRDASKSRNIPIGARSIDKAQHLVDLSPELVVEAASRDAVEVWGPIALSVAKTVIISSTSAFTDNAVLTQLKEEAKRHASRLIIPTGAIGGIDALSSAALLSLTEVVHRIAKPPSAWRGTKADKIADLSSLSEKTTFFSGSAREAASAFPQNANATAVTSLAGIGLDKTIVELVADPYIKCNQHTISAQGDFGQLTIHLENKPLQRNPKSSELTALNLTKLIEDQASPIVIS
jgi:aspartate dehydrogenase